MKQFDVAVIGRCVQDHILLLDRNLSDFLKQDDLRIEATDYSTMGGGPGATAAIIMSILGLKVAFVGRIGDDSVGKNIKNEISSHGINVDGLECDNSINSRSTFVIVNGQTHTRSFASYGTTFPVELTPNQWLILENSASLHLDWYSFASLKAAKLFREKNKRITYDIFHFNPIIKKQAKLCEIVTLSKYAANQYMKGKLQDLNELNFECENELEPYRRYFNNLCGKVIVTLGEKGCIFYSKEETKYYPAIQQEFTLDTTGAGDVFNGALSTSLSWNKDLDSSIKFATASASLSCKGLGGRGYLPSLEEINTFLANNIDSFLD